VRGLGGGGRGLTAGAWGMTLATHTGLEPRVTASYPASINRLNSDCTSSYLISCHNTYVYCPTHLQPLLPPPPCPCRDLSSPFVSDLESLLEQLNPHYCRSSRQHTPPAVLAALSDGGALALHSFTTWPHSLGMARAGVLQDLLGGFAVVRPYLAASSSHRKAFHQVRGVVGRPGGGGELCAGRWAGGRLEITLMH
jgi:hypothetical protein